MLCGVGRGSCPPGPNPKPDVQVSKHPALQLFLDCLRTFPSSLRSMARGTQQLDVVQRVGLFEVGKLTDGPDVIEIGTNPAKPSVTLLALVASAS